MVTLTDQALKEFKEISDKEGIKYKSEDEMRTCANSLLQFADIIIDQAMIDFKRRKRLKDEPKGFHLEPGNYYTCRLCHKTIQGEETWWDLAGIRCMDCQHAIEKRVIPKRVLKSNKGWGTDWHLERYLGLKRTEVSKLIKEGKLKPRLLKGKNDRTYLRVFLIEENPHITDLIHTRVDETKTGSIGRMPATG